MKPTKAVTDAIEAARKEGRVEEGPPVRLPEFRGTAMTEKEFQQRVVLLAKAHGWLVHHARPARTANGEWRTPIMGDVGFPDLVLARRGVVVFAELKSDKGRLTKEQDVWLDALTQRQMETHIVMCWRPSDLPAIERLLQ